MQDGALLWSFLPLGTVSIWHSEAQSHPLSLFSIHADGYCLIMNTAGCLRLCHYILRIGFASWPYLILSYLPLLYCVLPETLAHCWFGAYKIPTDVDPSVFTSRPRPCSVVSNMAPGRPELDLDAFCFLSPRLCWEDLIQLIMIGNINTFIIDMWTGEVTNG